MSRADRGGEIGEMGAVGGADLAQPRAGACHDVGQAERAADLDQLAARDDRLAPVGQRVQRQHQGAGIVVDGERRLGPGQPDRASPKYGRRARRAGRSRCRIRVSTGRASPPPPQRSPLRARARGRDWCAIRCPVRLKTRRCDGRSQARRAAAAVGDDRRHRGGLAGIPPLGQCRPARRRAPARAHIARSARQPPSERRMRSTAGRAARPLRSAAVMTRRRLRARPLPLRLQEECAARRRSRDTTRPISAAR